ncbi:MAG: transposase [Myxococcales bacterium]
MTLWVGQHVWNLRSGRSFKRSTRCFEKARGRLGLRVIEFSVLGNHLHLIVEADSNEALSRGMQGLCIRIAKTLNTLMNLSGRVFADHYHSRLLRTPTELVNAIRYVLENFAHHFGKGARDPYSSARCDREALLATPVSWLLRVGRWRAKPALDPSGPAG